MLLLQALETTETVGSHFDLNTLFQTLSGVVIAWLGYNQYSKNKKTDKKLEQQAKEISTKERERSFNYATIYGKLWKLLYSIDCDRVSIIQPHPLNKKQYLSIGLEVKRDGIITLKKQFYKVEIEEVPKFVSDLSEREFLYYKTMRTEAGDKMAASLFSLCGVRSVVIRRLLDDEEQWIGSIICDWCREKQLYPDFIRKSLGETAEDIQYILPEYDENYRNE